MATSHPLTRAERAAAIDYYLVYSPWVDDAMRSAIDLGSAAAILRMRFAPTQAGSFSPVQVDWYDLPITERTFEYDTRSAGVQFWRNAPGEDWPDSPPAATITWREMAEHLRGGAEQLEMFA